jgi:hypothetical protein
MMGASSSPPCKARQQRGGRLDSFDLIDRFLCQFISHASEDRSQQGNPDCSTAANLLSPPLRLTSPPPLLSAVFDHLQCCWFNL